MSAPERPPSLDPVAAARWSAHPVGEASPWLHEEVASRMQERLDFIKLQPKRWVHWEPWRGGLQAQRALQKRYPKAEVWFTSAQPAEALAVRAAGVVWVCMAVLRRSVEALGAVGGGVGEGRFAGDHLRQQLAAHRAQGQAVVGVAEVEPQAGVARGRADHRAHVRQARAAAQPGFGVEAFAQGVEAAGQGFAVERSLDYFPPTFKDQEPGARETMMEKINKKK